MNVVTIGAGCVGLVSGACFSEFSANVICVDLDQARIDRLKAGEMPIYEPGLASLVERNLAPGQLEFTADMGPAVCCRGRSSTAKISARLSKVLTRWC